MREERGKGIPSKHRDDSVEDNLKQFEDMTTGSKEGSRWCLRAKISVDDNNKALRDPVIYRVNTLPHHRTGYISSDFAVLNCFWFWEIAISGRCIPPTILPAPLSIQSKVSHMHSGPTNIEIVIRNIIGWLKHWASARFTFGISVG